MKKIIFAIITGAIALPAIAQSTKEYINDAQLSRWEIDANILGGLSNQNYTVPNSTGNYLNSVDANTGNLKYNKGIAYGADAQLGFFFGKKRHFGIGTGFIYVVQQGYASLDNFQIGYQTTDFKGSTFRQVLTGHDISENLNITNLNIPLVFKYKNRFSKKWGFTADAGILYNVKMQNKYNTHANFDYEAIYKFANVGDATNVPIYENAATPSVNDWLITKAEFYRNNPNGNIQDYFNTKRALGYNVGLNLPPSNTKGTVNYPEGNVGLMLQPSMNYFLSNHVALNFGVYYLFQPFKSGTNSAYKLNDGTGNYSSVLSSTSKVENQSYGLNIGARFFLGKKRATLSITSIDHTAPTICGLNDGSIAINGLRPNQPISVNYKWNDAQAVTYPTTVSAEGVAKVNNLLAGNYTGIEVTLKNQMVKGEPVMITDPVMMSPSQLIANPTEAGACNGFVIFKGLAKGSSVTFTYQLNGSAHAPYTGIVDTNKLLTMNDLCEGKYTGMVATINKCSAPCMDFTLKAPIQQEKSNVSNDDDAKRMMTSKNIFDDNSLNSVSCTDITTPMYFDVNLYTLHIEALAVIAEAAKQMKLNKNYIVTIQGNADSTGEEAKNLPLSVNRANAVKQELMRKGIKETRIKIIGHGSKDPVATNRTYIGKEENRNAVMTITDAKNEILAEDKK